jgi:hypothetical protein
MRPDAASRRSTSTPAGGQRCASAVPTQCTAPTSPVRELAHRERLGEPGRVECDADLLERLAGGGLGGRLTGVDLAAGHVVHVAIARGDHQHAPVAHERDGGDVQVGRLRHPLSLCRARSRSPITGAAR